VGSLLTRMALGILLAANVASAALAQSWTFDTEVDAETGKSWRSATLKTTDASTELMLGCDRKPWNRHGTLRGAVFFKTPFRKTTLLNVLHRFEGADAVTARMMQDRDALVFGDHDHIVAWARALARYSRWSAHANDRSVTFDLPTAPEERQAIATLVADCLKEKE
jgi:hypothetical protein